MSNVAPLRTAQAATQRIFRNSKFTVWIHNGKVIRKLWLYVEKPNPSDEAYEFVPLPDANAPEGPEHEVLMLATNQAIEDIEAWVRGEPLPHAANPYESPPLPPARTQPVQPVQPAQAPPALSPAPVTESAPASPAAAQLAPDLPALSPEPGGQRPQSGPQKPTKEPQAVYVGKIHDYGWMPQKGNNGKSYEQFVLRLLPDDGGLEDLKGKALQDCLKFAQADRGDRIKVDHFGLVTKTGENGSTYKQHKYWITKI